MSGRILKLILSLVVGAVCLWFAFRGTPGADGSSEWPALRAALVSVPAWSYAVFVLSFLVQVVLRTERWRGQLAAVTGAKPAMRPSLAVNAVAFAAVFLLPFRLGEFVRPNLAAQRGYMPASQGLAATAIERVADGIVTTGIFGIVMLFMGDRPIPASVRVGGFTALLIFGGASVFFAAAFAARGLTTRFVERIIGVVHVGFAQRVRGLLAGFLDGLACFRTPRDIAVYAVLTVSYWLMNVLGTYAIMRGIGIEEPPIAAFFVVCFLVIGVMLPAPPGNVGNFHAFARAALAVFAVPGTTALAVAIILHGLTVVLVVVWALLFLLTGDVDVARLRAATGQGAPPPSSSPPSETLHA